MRNGFVTPFWQRAYDSLPSQVRGQHYKQMKAAERWELALQDAIELGSRIKNAVVRLLQTPSRAH